MPARATLERLPVLPLPGVVLVPGMVLPLNVTRPAELELVDFIRERDSHLGVPLLRPQQPREADGEPAFESVFGLGRMTQHIPLGDGRRVIRLEGVARVRLVREHQRRRGFREVAVTPLVDPRAPDAEELTVLRAQIERIAAHDTAYELALAVILDFAQPAAFLDALTTCLPFIELLGREGQVSLQDFSSQTTALQQQALAAASAEQRLTLLCERATAALTRLKRYTPPRLTN